MGYVKGVKGGGIVTLKLGDTGNSYKAYWHLMKDTGYEGSERGDGHPETGDKECEV